MTLKTIKNALLSVSDKKGILPFAQELHRLGVNLISTGGTCQLLQKANIPVTEVSTITGFPEMMDGRLKTLHPKIHGGILGRRTIDQDIANTHGIDWIDLVVVNLYPFAEVTQRTNVAFEEAIENIDIGGPAMIRSAAKNMDDVVVVVDPKDYEDLLQQLNNEGGTTLVQRQRFAIKAFECTALYDALIHRYLQKRLETQNTPTLFPEQMNLSLSKAIDLRYGENPNKKACAYQIDTPPKGIFSAKQHQGKTLSYNNLLDADSAIHCLHEFDEAPSCVIIKHTNPCGVASANTIADAFHRAFDTDSQSAFGGIVALNRTCDENTANAMSKFFFEVVIAPSYTQNALALFSKKPNVRVLELPLEKQNANWAYQWLEGGVLIQSHVQQSPPPSLDQVVTQQKLTPESLNDLWFAWRAVKHIKSNAILIAKNSQAIGVGAGQVSRVDAVEIAIRKAGDRLAGTVLASDAFFPFRDSIDRMANTGITSIIQPGGSIKDQEVIDACNEHGIAMLMTGLRCFKH